IRNEDFVVAACRDCELFDRRVGPFNTAIVNPPYQKIRSDSPTRRALSTVGIETSNLYTAFLTLIVRLLEPSGELVAITPRSFCNGTYFRPFRAELLRLMNLDRLHVFDSRKAAFSADGVLQENVIFHGVKRLQRQDRVIVSFS